MTLADELQALEPRIQPSPWAGHEYVKGFGVFALPFDSGHVLALRVFPENDFAPYVSVWHRTPDGRWSIFYDAPSADASCPRYFGAACERLQPASIRLEWTGPRSLTVTVAEPSITWELSMAEPGLYWLMNRVCPLMPVRWWRSPFLLRAFEFLAGRVFGLGDVSLSATAPNGQFSILMPQRMFRITVARAQLEGVDLGQATRSATNPAIGAIRLPSAGVFAVGQGYFEVKDPEATRRTLAELAKG